MGSERVNLKLSKYKTFLWRLHLVQQSIEFSGDAVCKFLTPVLRWAKDEYGATGRDGLQTQWNYVAIVTGLSRRQPGGDGP